MLADRKILIIIKIYPKEFDSVKIFIRQKLTTCMFGKQTIKFVIIMLNCKIFFSRVSYIKGNAIVKKSLQNDYRPSNTYLHFIEFSCCMQSHMKMKKKTKKNIWRNDVWLTRILFR